MFCTSLSWSNMDVVVQGGSSGSLVGVAVGTRAFHPDPPADIFQNESFSPTFHVLLRVPGMTSVAVPKPRSSQSHEHIPRTVCSYKPLCTECVCIVSQYSTIPQRLLIAVVPAHPRTLFLSSSLRYATTLYSAESISKLQTTRRRL